jgi:hypothetical protein
MPEVVEEELEERGREVEGSSVFTSEDLALFFRVVICLCKELKELETKLTDGHENWLVWPSVRTEKIRAPKKGAKCHVPWDPKILKKVPRGT